MARLAGFEPATYGLEVISSYQATTPNNNKFNVLKETVGCRLLWKTAIICGQVAFFWPFPPSYNITKLPIPAKWHRIA